LRILEPGLREEAAVPIRLEDRGMHIAFATDGWRISETGGDSLDCLGNVVGCLALAVERAYRP
jgi:hypothetical protein